VADCGGIDLREGAILGMSAGLSQISIVPGPDSVTSPGSFIGGIEKIGCLYFSILPRKWYPVIAFYLLGALLPVFFPWK